MHWRCCLLVTRMRSTVWYAGAYDFAYQTVHLILVTGLSGILEHVLLHTRQSTSSLSLDCLVSWSICSCIPDSPPHHCHQQSTSPVHYTTICKHSLVLRRMGEIIARNMLSWLQLLIKFVIVASSWLLTLLYQWCTVTHTHTWNLISTKDFHLLYLNSVYSL
jgi:hypothetical protein